MAGETCVATSIEGFVNLVVQLITHGYYFYVAGDTRTERERAPHEIDRRIVEKFRANEPKWTRHRRRRLGLANVRYVRYGKDWFLFSTYGKHKFFEEHLAKEPGGTHQFSDIREEPIKFHGYWIGLTKRGYEKKSPEERMADQLKRLQAKAARDSGEAYERVPRGRRHERWTGRVCIERSRYLALRDELVGLAVHRSVENLTGRFYTVPFEPFAPVRQQLYTILREVNRMRRHVGYEPVPHEAVRFKRKHVPAFRAVDGVEGSNAADSAAWNG